MSVRKVFPLFPKLSDVLRIHHVFASRKLAQNFIFDENILRKFVRDVGKITPLRKDCEILEIGPGPGSITRAFLEYDVNKLFVVEKDQRFLPILLVSVCV